MHVRTTYRQDLFLNRRHHRGVRHHVIYIKVGIGTWTFENLMSYV